MTDETERRQQSAAILRAIADLIEQHPEVKEPRVSVDWYFQGADPAPAMRLATGVLPGPWTASQTSSGKSEWLNLDAGTAAGAGSPGVRLQVTANAAAVCEKAGTRTVTVWKPSPAIADLITGEVQSDG
jgi:hypothetical protein